MGAGRVGCDPCIHVNHSEFKNMIKTRPESIEKVRTAENEVKRTFLSPDYIPERYLTGFDSKSGKKICKIDDAVRYISDKNRQYDMIDSMGLGSNCNSVYAICE